MYGKIAQLAPLAACSLAIAWSLAPIARAADVVNDIPFPSPGAPGNVLTLDLYLPHAGVPPNGFTIVLVHGGSYNSGSSADLGPLCAALADRGYAVVDPNYTLVTPNNIPSYPQPISDILNVVHWVRTDGEQLNLPNRVIISGISAGSTIAMTAAMAAPTSVFNRLPAPAHRGYAIDGAIGVMGRYDLVWNAYFGIPATVINYIGVPFTRPDWMQVWAQASAISYINANSPPTVLYHGAIDGLVPPANSSRLALAMQMAGAPNQLNIVPGFGHDMSVLGYTFQQQAQTLANAAAWIDAHPGNIISPPTGICCALNGQCAITTAADCTTTWAPNVACAPNLCPQPPPTGACCSAGGVCSSSTNASCAGAWTIAAPCTPNPCAQPSGACCAANGACAAALQSECPAAWTMFGSCSPNLCSQPTGACCAADGSCAAAFQPACSGAWTMLGACDPNPCPQPPPPTGACCMGSTCAVALASNCAGPNRRFTAVNAACNNSGDHQTPCCHADFNQNAAVNVSDIFDFLSAWFAGSADACISSPTTAAPAVTDIFDFLSAWFSGC